MVDCFRTATSSGNGAHARRISCGRSASPVDTKPRCTFPCATPPKIGRNEPCTCGSGKRLGARLAWVWWSACPSNWPDQARSRNARLSFDRAPCARGGMGCRVWVWLLRVLETRRALDGPQRDANGQTLKRAVAGISASASREVNPKSKIRSRFMEPSKCLACSLTYSAGRLAPITPR